MAWPLVRTWLLGEGVTDLFVLRAHLLAAPRWEDLVSLRAGSQMRLWLIVHRGSPTPAQQAALARARWTSLTASEFAEGWSGVPGHESEGERSRPLPAEGFVLFRAMCRWALPPEEFERIDRILTAARAKTMEWLRAWPEGTPLSRPAIHAFLQRLTADSPDAADALVRFRGAQAQLFRQGWLLWARAQEGCLFDPTQEVVRLDRPTAQRLRAIADPRSAALAVAVLVSEARPSTALRMQVRDVRAGELAVDGKHYGIPPWAEGLVAALTGERRRAGARARDPLFLSRRGEGPLEDGEASAMLDHVAARTGIAIRPESQPPYWEPPSRWLNLGALGLVEIGTPPQRRSPWFPFD